MQGTALRRTHSGWLLLLICCYASLGLDLIFCCFGLSRLLFWRGILVKGHDSSAGIFVALKLGLKGLCFSCILFCDVGELIRLRSAILSGA